MSKTILVMGGSFNPPTVAHQRLMLSAIEAMEADKGIFVPSPHNYVKAKMRRAKHPGEVLPENLRLAMLQAMAAEDPRLAVDDCEYHRLEKGFTYETMELLQGKYPAARLFFLAGGDKVHIIPRWHRIREFVSKFEIVIVKRDGDNPEIALRENPFLREHRAKFHVIRVPEGLEGISSSAVRDRLRTGSGGAPAMLHPRVWELLQQNGGMRKYGN